MRVTFRRSAMLNTSSHYKPSRFNARTTAPDGSLVICNTFSGHACVVSPSGANPVKRYLSRLGWDDELDDLGRYLLNNGYLVHADTDELAKWDISFAQFHYRTDALRLVLFASEDCNFRCIYCSQPFRFGSMLPSVRTGIRKFVEQKLAKLRYLSISWFGGDALAETSDHGYPVLEHVKRLVDDQIIWAPAIAGAFVLTTRGGDFGLHIGQDVSIGYLNHTDAAVRLYLQESFTFLLLTTSSRRAGSSREGEEEPDARLGFFSQPACTLSKE